MKLKLTLNRTHLLIFVMFLMPGMSEAGNHKSTISIAIGPSAPTGNFASNNGYNSSAGFAGTGFLFDVAFSKKIGNGMFGYTALMRSQSFSTNTQTLANQLIIDNPSMNWRVESSIWSVSALMFGGFSEIPINEKASFENRLMFGLLSASSPEIAIIGSRPGVSEWWQQNSKVASSLAYLIGAGVKYDIGKNTFFLFDLDFLGASPEFRDVIVTSSDGSRKKSTWRQNIGTLNFSLGLAFKI